ncbi:MAG: YfhO family protein [Lachnospiraceae bacterium]|nr:YfhO family protein [Lachnospiraceae bacterium]
MKRYEKTKKSLYDEVVVALGTFIVIPFILYFDTLFDGGVNVNFDGLFGYSVLDFYHKTILNGEFPLWNKYVEGGVVMGSFHTVGLYPAAFLFSFLPAETFSFLFYFFHLSLGAYFFFQFLKELGCDWYASFATAVIYEMSIHIGGYRKEHFTIIIGIVYLPVILFFIQKYINKKKLYWLVYAGIAMGFQFLGSHTQIVVYTDIAVFLYLLVHLIVRKRNCFKCMLHIVIWGLVYLGTMLGQLYITGLAIFSIGETGGKAQSAMEYLKSYSIHYMKLFMMVFPELFGEDNLMPLGVSYSSEMDIEIFLGFCVFLLVCFGIFKMWKRFEISLAVLFMTGSLLYASMGHIPFMPEIISRIPVLNSFRVPSRSLFLFIFYEFVILAVVLSEIKNPDKLKELSVFLKKAAYFTAGSIVMLVLAGIAAGTVYDTEGVDRIRVLKRIFGSAFMICAATPLLLRLSQWAVRKFHIKTGIVHIVFCAAIVCITAAETHPYAVRSYRNLDGYLAQEPSEIENRLAAENYKVINAFDRVGVQDNSFIAYNNSVRNKVQSINAYVTYNNMNTYKLLTGNGDVRLNNTDMFYVFPNMEQILYGRNSALSVLGVKYIIDSCDILSQNPVYVEGKRKAAYIPYYDDGKTKIYLNPNAKDILFSTEKTERIEADENIYLHLNDYDLLNVSYVTDYPDTDDGRLGIAEIENVNFKMNSITAAVSCDKETFINFSQNYHNGWKAYIDGAETEVYLVDEAIMGIKVPAGDHVIEFVFRLPAFYICILISLATVISGSIYGAVGLYRDRRKRRNRAKQALPVKAGESA